MKKTSVAIFGKGDLCIKACELISKSDKYELSYVVPVKPEPNWTGSVYYTSFEILSFRSLNTEVFLL